MHQTKNRLRRIQGFSLVEMLVIVSVMLVVIAIAIPQVASTVNYFQFRGAIASVTGAIQTTRYLAISQGVPYRLAFTKATSSFQVTYDPTRTNTYVVVSGAVGDKGAFNGSWNTKATLSADTTLQFNPSGVVTATTGAQTFTLTYGKLPVETITVSNYGRVNVTP